MSCNGCRVLRKGCTENCILRQSLQGIQSPRAQAHATLFVAKFFGRAGLISFLSSVPDSQRPALFQSLLFEACGRTVNPVNGAVGLLWTGNWRVCQSAVETVLRGGALRQIPEFLGGGAATATEFCGTSGSIGEEDLNSRSERKRCDEDVARLQAADLDLQLTNGFQGRAERRPYSPSLNSEESETTTLGSETAYPYPYPHQELGGECEGKLLRLFF